MRRSVSQLKSYVTCPEAFRLRRVARVPTQPAAWTVQGIAVHAAIEAYEKSWRTISVAEAEDVFEQVWVRGVAEALEREPDLDAWMTGGKKKTEKDIEDRHLAGAGQVRTYVEYVATDPLRVWTLPDTGEPASEVEFLITLGNVDVRGFIDLILVDPQTGQLKVRDIKTGSKRPSDAIQLAVYRQAVMDCFGVDVRWGDYWMAKDGRPMPPEPLAKFTREWLIREFRMMDDAESRGDYPSNPGDHCRICDVAAHCLVKS
ncbi:PD-(D/E)XK nuclease family protein [Streptosporangium sp. NPDC020072]|uniref:RecB family exonuclease n=1 Tax=Streptosporangium sp. NPDC020072 TaxID=3154788 RepID=UPI00342F90B7